MRVQFKLMALVLTLLTGVTAAVLWNQQNQLTKNFENEVQATSTQVLSGIKQAVQSVVSAERARLVEFAIRREATGPGKVRGFGDFDMIALIKDDRAKVDQSGVWSPMWIEKGPRIQPQSWTGGFEFTLLKSLSFNKTKAGETLVQRVADSQGRPTYAFLAQLEVKGEKVIAVGLTARNPLMSLTQDLLGSPREVYLVEDRGYVLSHPQKAYEGASLSDDQLTQTTLKSQKLQGGGTFTGLDGEKIRAEYQKVENTNLTLIFAERADSLQASVVEARNGILKLIAPLALLFMGIAWILGAQLSQARVELAPHDEMSDTVATELTAETLRGTAVDTPAAESSVATVPVTEPKASELSQLAPSFATESPRPHLGLPLEFVESVASSFKPTLLTAIAKIELARANAENPQEYLQEAEGELRSMKNIVDKLSQWQSQTQQDNTAALFEKTDLATVIRSEVGDWQTEAEKQAVRIFSDIEDVPSVNVNSVMIREVFNELVSNAFKAMTGRYPKELRIKLSCDGMSAVLLIQDNGRGMSSYAVENACNPFFKEFSNTDSIGLGLSLVKKSVDANQATMRIDSSPGDGTKVSIKFAVAPEDFADFSAGASKDMQRIYNQSRDVKVPAKVVNFEPPILLGLAAPTIEATVEENRETLLEADEHDEFQVAVRPPRRNDQSSTDSGVIKDGLSS